jgi:hypothetical protein
MTQHTDPTASTHWPSVSRTLVGVLALFIAPAATAADDAGGGDAYLAFVRVLAPHLRGGDAFPRSLAAWTEHRPGDFGR